MSRINEWLLKHDIRIAENPCISPDFCLDWPSLRDKLQAGVSGLRFFERSAFNLPEGDLKLVEDPATGDRAWHIRGNELAKLSDGVKLAQGWAYPATFSNLIALKNAVLAHDPESTIFPVARGPLARSSIGVGARFTTLHWPAVDWAMAQLGLSLTANQNSIPRELVFDVDTMLDDKLDTCRFPFIGGDVPEGHQGQSVEGMSHGAILAKLENGFHHHRTPWGFNADHQPIGGKYDTREDQLVRGCLFSTYITFDLSPELMATQVPDSDAEVHASFERDIPKELADRVRERVSQAGLSIDSAAFQRLLVSVWPAMQKMKRRDEKYRAARIEAFKSSVGQAYFRELSIDELPGLTTPETLATMLALAEAMDMPVQFVAPAFGFQKNFPFEDNEELRRRIDAAWSICKRFGVSIGFHSGSGKSEQNYRLIGQITGGNLEIKTSGRYTYEMGVALSLSEDPKDRQLWQDWYAFTREMALASAFSTDAEEARMARSFIEHALNLEGKPANVFSERSTCKAALEALEPSPDHMFWFEYNFLYVLAAEGKTDKSRLGDHGPAGYAQRARFYAISDAGRLSYARRVAGYILFLAETTGLASQERCQSARQRLGAYANYGQLLADIAPPA